MLVSGGKALHGAANRIDPVGVLEAKVVLTAICSETRLARRRVDVPPIVSSRRLILFLANVGALVRRGCRRRKRSNHKRRAREIVHGNPRGHLARARHARPPHILHIRLPARTIRRHRSVGPGGPEGGILCHKDVALVLPERLQVARARRVLHLVENGGRAVLGTNRLSPAAPKGLPRDAKVGVAVSRHGRHGPGHIEVAAAHRGAVVPLGPNVLCGSCIRGLLAALEALPVRGNLPVSREGFVAQGGLHAGNRRGLNRVRSGSSRRGSVVVPHERARRVICGHIHVLGRRAGSHRRELHVISGQGVENPKVLRRARSGARLRPRASRIHQVIDLLDGKAAQVGEGRRLHPAQLLERHDLGLRIGRGALGNRRRVKRAVLQAQRHGIGASGPLVLAKGSRYKHKVVHSLHRLDEPAVALGGGRVGAIVKKPNPV
mmetsp:Transcript_16763/g.33049  ORF Transcript_16763/g.33049 Transcript_16763/m.33049 type:complete len:434 (-) Transcript_16763:100-1401(-)